MRHNLTERRGQTLVVRCFMVLWLLAGVTSLRADSTVNIHGIQIDLPSSPYLGDTVTTTGIVIAVLSDGFHIENPLQLRLASGLYIGAARRLLDWQTA